MHINTLLNQIWRKPEQPAASASPAEKTLAHLNGLCVLRADNYPCDKCSIEIRSCTKLHFSDRTICVCPEQDVITFRPRKKMSKPSPKV